MTRLVTCLGCFVYCVRDRSDICAVLGLGLLGETEDISDMGVIQSVVYVSNPVPFSSMSSLVSAFCSPPKCVVHASRSSLASGALSAMSGAAKTPAKRGRSAVDKAHEADGSTLKDIRVMVCKTVQEPLNISNPSPFGCER
eukprot:6491858-Amphidinium_carterae.2